MKRQKYKTSPTLSLLLLIAFSLLCTSPATAGIGSYLSLNIEDGLSQATVNSVAQDKQGYVWIATQDGLNRYDGYRVKNYFHDPKDPKSLSHNYVIKIVVDAAARIWLLTGNGINQYLPMSDTFVHYTTNKHNVEFFEQLLLWSMHNVDENYLWVATDNGILEFNKNTGSFLHITSGFEFGITSQNIYDFGEAQNSPDNHNRIIATDNGLFQNSSNERKFSRLELPDVNGENKDPRVYCSSNQFNSFLFLCSRNGLYYFRGGKSGFLSNDELGLESQASKLLISSIGELWIGTFNGLYKINLSQTVEELSSIEIDSVSLIGNTIKSLMEDKDGVIWVGTDISGVFRILPLSRVFEHFSDDSQVPRKIPHSLISTIKQSPQKTVWIGDSRGGLSIIKDNKVKRTLSLNDANNRKMYHNILDIEFDHIGNKWITTAMGITQLSENNEQLAIYELEDPLLTQKTYATQLLVTEGEQIWATGLASGLSYLSKSSNKFHSIRPANWPIDQPFAKQVYTAINVKKTFWLAGYQGIIFRYDVQQNTAKSYYAVDSQDPAYSISQIYSMTRDQSGRLWLSGTGGIGFFDPVSEEFTHLGKFENFNTQTYYSVQADSEGFIWSTPTDSLIRIDPKTRKIISFNRNNGMPIIEFSPASLAHSDGTIWTGGLNGLVKFDPLQLTLNQAVQAPQLNQLEILTIDTGNSAASSWQEKNIAGRSTIDLPPKESTIRMSFGVLDFSLLNSLQYRYQLQGFDETWNSAETGQPEASYTRLPYGNYTFLVSTSFDGIGWTEPTSMIQINVLPHYWQSWWFRTLFVGLLLTTIFCILSTRHIQQEKRRLKLEQEVDRRTRQVTQLSNQRSRFYSFVSHELKTPLTLVQDPLARILNQTISTSERATLVATAYRNASRLSELVDRLLKEAFEEDHNFNKPINVKSKISECVNQLFEFAENRRVSVSLKELQDCYVDCLESDLESVIYNLLNNAIKYSRRNEAINLRCKTINGQVVFTVHNKITRKLEIQRPGPPRVANGFGFPIVEQAVAAIGGRFKFMHRFKEAVAIVTLPSHRVTQNPEPHQTNELFDKKDSLDKEKGCLLIVEDNQELRQYLMDTFKNDYVCLASASAEQALNMAIEHIPDIIVSDVVLPGKSGVELCGELQSRQETSHIPFLILTGKTDQNSIINGLKHQATDYLTKPFNTQELKLRIQNLLRITRQNYLHNQVVSLNHRYTKETNTPKGLAEKDIEFMRRFIEALELNFANCDYNLDGLSKDLYMSKKQLSRKLKAISHKSPIEYLKEYRLEKSIQQLAKGKSLSVVASDSGFSSQSYYSTCFKSQFGKTPKQFQTTLLNEKRKAKT